MADGDADGPSQGFPGVGSPWTSWTEKVGRCPCAHVGAYGQVGGRFRLRDCGKYTEGGPLLTSARQPVLQAAEPPFLSVCAGILTRAHLSIDF